MGEAGLSEFESAIRHVTRIDSVDGTYPARIEVGKVSIEFDLTGAIDIVAERARLTKDLATAQKDLQTAKVKLENEGFMAKAPMEVVQEIRARQSETLANIERLTAALESLQNQ